MSAAPTIFQVNLPYFMIDELGPLFLEKKLSPEIGLEPLGRAEWILGDREPPGLADWAARFLDRPDCGGVTLHAPFMDLSPGAVDPAVLAVTRKRLVAAARLAGLFRAEALVGHNYHDHTRYFADQRWLDTAARTWRLVLDASAEWGGPVALENVYETDPDMIGRLLDLVDDPRLGFCFDVGHFNAWSAAPLSEWLDRLGPRISRLHLHDNDGGFDQHRVIGQGNFDFSALFDWLGRRGLRPGVTLEPHRIEDFEPCLAAAQRLWAKAFGD